MLALVAFATAAFWPLAPLLQTLVSPTEWASILEPRLASLFGRTLWMSGTSGLLALSLGWPAAVLASRLRLPGLGWVLFVLPLPLLLPPLLIAQAWHGLTGIDGPWASVWSLGVAYAPLSALFAVRALRHQQASAHESALLIAGPRFAISEMFRISAPAAILGAVLAAVFASTDFAVPDYFASLGDKFSVYPAEVFNHWRSYQGDPATLEAGAAVAAPLVAVSALVLYLAFTLRDKAGALESNSSRLARSVAPGILAWPLAGILIGIMTLLFFLPLGRILFETGAAGPEATGTWTARSADAFQDAIARGRNDLGNSLSLGALSAGFALLVAPLLAHFWLQLTQGPSKAHKYAARLFGTLIALPLLAPSVGTGLGAILAFNQPGWERFYDSLFMPGVVLGGRYLPIAVFILAERMARVPNSRVESAALTGMPYLYRLLYVRLATCRGAWLLGAGLVAVFAIRELDLAVLLPAANASAAVRYYNALHFARDNFVAAFGLMIAFLLFLPVALHALLHKPDSK